MAIFCFFVHFFDDFRFWKKNITQITLFLKYLNGIFNFRTLCKQRRLEYWSKLKIAQLRRDYIVCRKQWMFLFNLFTHHTISTQKVAYCFLKPLSIESNVCMYIFPFFLITAKRKWDRYNLVKIWWPILCWNCSASYVNQMKKHFWICTKHVNQKKKLV